MTPVFEEKPILIVDAEEVADPAVDVRDAFPSPC
jgi:hypothetical protein